MLRRTLPAWTMPEDVEAVVAAEGFWESDHWDPIMLSVEGDTEYEGRLIPMRWQIEFVPYSPEFVEANQRLDDGLGVTPDGYKWSDAIQNVIRAKAPKVFEEMHDDSGQGSCVLWVESEAACRALIETVWEMIYR